MSTLVEKRRIDGTGIVFAVVLTLAIIFPLIVVGTHGKEFRFDRRYRALLGGTSRDVERSVQMQFPFLPVGDYVLEARRDGADSR